MIWTAYRMSSLSNLRDMHLQPTTLKGQEAHQQQKPPSFALLHEAGSPDFLATKHHVNVSALTGWAMRPYPPHYRAAFAFSTFLPHTSNGWPYGSLAQKGEGTVSSCSSLVTS